MVNENLDSLPDEPANLAGESVDKGARYNIKVSNAAGYLCHIHMEVIALPMLLKRMGLSACLYESVACQFWCSMGLTLPVGLRAVDLQVPAGGALQDLHQSR